MRRIAIPLILAALIAVGVTVTIIIQVISVSPPGGVLLLVPQGITTKSYVYQILLGTNVQHFMPLGYGKLTLRPNTTGWYYYADTRAPGIVAVSKPFTGVIKVTVDGTDYYLCNNSNYGAVVRAKDSTGWVGDWVMAGSYFILNPRNASDNTNYRNCAVSVSNTVGKFVFIYEPRSDYFSYNAATNTVTVYYDAIDQYNFITKYGSITFTPAWTQLPANTDTVVGTYSATSNSEYLHYRTLIYLWYNGTVTSQIQVTPTP
jgi:hypothetical protein